MITNSTSLLDLEFIQITCSSRGRAKSLRPRRQVKKARRRSYRYVENVFAPTTQESGFTAGRNRAGYLDTLDLNKQTQFPKGLD